MELGARQHIQLAHMMKDKGPVWQRLAREHGLRNFSYEEIVLWNYGDYVFSTGYDLVSSTIKAREYGFADFVDTEKMFLRQFDELRASKVIRSPKAIVIQRRVGVEWPSRIP